MSPRYLVKIDGCLYPYYKAGILLTHILENSKDRIEGIWRYFEPRYPESGVYKPIKSADVRFFAQKEFLLTDEEQRESLFEM